MVKYIQENDKKTRENRYPPIGKITLNFDELYNLDPQLENSKVFISIIHEDMEIKSNKILILQNRVSIK